MSDQAQGPGWWQASDGRWYPPETHPNYKPAAPAAPQAPPVPPVVAPTASASTPPIAPSPQSAPVTGAAIPSGWEAPANPPGAPLSPTAAQPNTSPANTTGQGTGTTPQLRMNGSPERSKWPLVLGVVAVLAVLGIGLAAIMGGDDTVELGTENPTPAATVAPDPTVEPQPTAEPAPTPTPDESPVVTAGPEPTPEEVPEPDPEPTFEPDPDLDPPPLVVPDGDIPSGVPASPSGELGSVGNPAAFGTVFAFDDFAVTITNVEYATQEMLSEWSDPPSPGSVYVVMTTSTTYYGGEAVAYGPIQPSVWIDDLELYSWESDCYLNDDLNETYIFTGGQSGISSLCFEIPEDQLADTTFAVDDFLDARHFAVGATATQEAPSFTQADLADRGPGSPADPYSVGTVFEFDEWTGSIVTATDARDAGQLSPDVATRDGYIPLWVVAEYTYNGTEETGFLPPSPVAAGSRVFASYEDDFCILDYSTRGDFIWEAEPGETVLVESCLSIPEEELATVLLVLYGDWTDTEVIYDLN